MEKLKTVLKKRTSKAILYILTECLLLPVTISLIINTIQEFSWYKVVFCALFLFGILYIGKSLVEYFTFGIIKLIVECDGKSILFYSCNSRGMIFNKSQKIDLSEIGKFYIVRKRTRYLMNNYSFAFESKGSSSSFFRTDIDAFPSLFYCTEQKRNNVLSFVKKVCPEIELGYESMWKKMSTNKKSNTISALVVEK